MVRTGLQPDVLGCGLQPRRHRRCRAAGHGQDERVPVPGQRRRRLPARPGLRPRPVPDVDRRGRRQRRRVDRPGRGQFPVLQQADILGAFQRRAVVGRSNRQREAERTNKAAGEGRSPGRPSPLLRRRLIMWFLNRRHGQSALRSHPPGFRPRLEALEDRSLPSTLTVVNLADQGPGSLRAAITAANAHPGADTVAFNIAGAGVRTINLASALPAITGTITIAGNTQPGFAGNPLIELNGTSAGPSASGLVVNASGSVIRGLVINRFAGDGVQVRGSGSRVEGCFIGTSAAGTVAAANGLNGVRVFAGADNVTIGGTAAGAKNVLSGNRKAGVLIQGAGTTANKVQGNLIGLGATGAALANKVGVWVTGRAT